MYYVLVAVIQSCACKLKEKNNYFQYATLVVKKTNMTQSIKQVKLWLIIWKQEVPRLSILQRKIRKDLKTMRLRMMKRIRRLRKKKRKKRKRKKRRKKLMKKINNKMVMFLKKKKSKFLITRLKWQSNQDVLNIA